MRSPREPPISDQEDAERVRRNTDAERVLTFLNGIDFVDVPSKQKKLQRKSNFQASIFVIFPDNLNRTVEFLA